MFTTNVVRIISGCIDLPETAAIRIYIYISFSPISSIPFVSKVYLQELLSEMNKSNHVI